MYPQKELEVKLFQLKDILSEMKALLEWQKLKVFENTRNPSRQLFFSDDTPQQLSHYTCQFYSVSAEIELVLKANTHFAKRSSILKELNKRHCQLYYLGTDVRIY